jgi:hypothetical protein
MSKGKELTENDVDREPSVTDVTRSLDRLNQKTKTLLFPLWQRYQERLTWKFWAAVFVIVFGGVGFLATWQLLNLQKSPNCPKIFWPIASASLRLYCAQLDADSRTVEGLLRAIELVAALPLDHPLRSQANQLVEEWSRDILNLAEKDYQAGHLDKAIATVRQIPPNVEVAAIIEERIQKWQETWKEGEEKLQQLEEHLRAANWNHAFRLAVDLLNLKNDYWATVKYNEAIQKISLAREDSSQLDNALNLFDRGGLDNWLASLEAALKIRPESYAYQGARKLIGNVEEKLQGYAGNLIEAKNWQGLQTLANRIPKDLAIQEEVEDWSILATAAIDADIGTVESVESAILTAEQIDVSRPLYSTARSIIDRWTLEIQDLKTLFAARDLAEPATIEALGTAISKAKLIPEGNPRAAEASQEIANWTRQIQVIEDRPILERAREIALAGDGQALQSAIAQAQAIGYHRALYSEAQGEIRGWQTRIERMEDQPILDRAIALANLKDYTTAIETAGQIRSGRALSDEARQNIRRWRSEVQAVQNLQQAYRLAATETVDGLSRAIGLVNRIPSSTDAGGQRSELIERWSYQLLSLATDQANYGRYAEAISIAEKIPSDSSAYHSARSQIQSWREILQPPAPAPIVEPLPVESPVPSPTPETTTEPQQ